MEKRELAIKIIYTLNQKGYAAYMVGGSVRDSYMGIEPYDYDIATSALPETVKKLFPKPLIQVCNTALLRLLKITSLLK